ncbi:HDOD domain-containing protein [Candidatus Nitronereus thalassa]|uniref:HDOD domain-containing protein n=1 Tax=Candidatus Nitronereus thalassa TaxID=3020898 RepID=A0ABU3K3J8_9BACT|nr:HDOD domain-containing protein [Candidatus Nitronereus thalassa]MDT7040969.1 HDOD domain-containing protein [Candidatus Nitronereus thalassa]
MQTEIFQSLKYCRTLPSIPVLAIQILSLCQDPKADSKKMAALISHDPAFSAKLLSLANSGFYARIQHQVTSLTQGVTLLGREAVAVLAFSFSLYRNLRGGEFGAFDHQRFWRRSILASIAGRALAKHTSFENYEEVFLGALLQDIGMLALSVVSPDLYPKVIAEAAHCHPRLQALEIEQFGADHAEVGAWLAKEWQLPEVYQKAISGSHQYPGGELSCLQAECVKYVALSGVFADIWCWSDTEKAVCEAMAAITALLDEDANLLNPILTEIVENIPLISALFEIDLGAPVEVQQTFEQAQKILLSESVVEC